MNILDHFIYRVIGYGEGDFSVRYYKKGESGDGLSSGVVRIRVTYNVGPLNQTVAVILSMEIDGMIEHYDPQTPEDADQFVKDVRTHAVMLFTNNKLEDEGEV